MSQILKVEYNGNFQIKEVTYENEPGYENGETWILSGYCCQCGKCCLDPNNNVGYNDETGKCSKLIYETLDGIVKYRCSIYPNRPISCMLWPTTQEEIDRYPECTLKFVKKV